MNILKITALLFLLISTDLFAGKMELLHPVDYEKSKKIQEYNGKYFKEITYFSSRYSIVRVNDDLLLNSKSNDEFTITPFVGETFHIITKSLVRKPGERAFWRGELVFPGLSDPRAELESKTEDERAGLTVEQAMSILFGINISIFSWDRNLDTDEVTIAYKTVSGNLQKEPKENHIPTRIKRNDFKSVSSTFSVLPTSQKFVLQPLKFTPKYHIIYEVDPEKVITSTENYAAPSTEENKRRVRQYREFQETLTEDGEDNID